MKYIYDQAGCLLLEMSAAPAVPQFSQLQNLDSHPLWEEPSVSVMFLLSLAYPVIQCAGGGGLVWLFYLINKKLFNFNSS